MNDDLGISLSRLLLRLTEATLLNPESRSQVSRKQINHDYKVVKKYLKTEINRRSNENE